MCVRNRGAREGNKTEYGAGLLRKAERGERKKRGWDEDWAETTEA
jgi:hypothetical protein